MISEPMNTPIFYPILIAGETTAWARWASHRRGMFARRAPIARFLVSFSVGNTPRSEFSLTMRARLPSLEFSL